VPGGRLVFDSLTVEHDYGGSDREPVGAGNGDLLVTARRS